MFRPYVDADYAIEVRGEACVSRPTPRENPMRPHVAE